MKPKEFIERYYLHDSYIQKVEYDILNRKITLDIMFSFWMQDFYKKGDAKQGTIKAVFRNVSKYNCDGGNPAAPLAGILTAKLRNNDLVLAILDDETGVCFEMTIAAESVEVVI